MMNERDCVLLMHELKPCLIQLLKVTHAIGHNYFYWNEEEGKVCLSTARRLFIARLTLVFQLLYVILQFHFTLESHVSVAGKLVASGLMSMTTLFLTARWELNPDEVSMQIVNGLLAQN